MLHFQKHTTASILKSFNCGIAKMDDFIHTSLDDVLGSGAYNFYVVKNDEGHIVAMFVYSENCVVLEKDSYLEVGIEGTDYAVIKDGLFDVMTNYPTLEIDYLAVDKAYRGHRIGTTIINQLKTKAFEMKKFFLTVNAYHESNYSAIEFYEKNKFIAVEKFDPDKDTLRMYACVL